MTPAELSRAVLSTVRRAVAAQELRVAVPDKVVVQRPPRPGCGDYATNVALQLAGPAGRTPYEVAAILARRLAKEPGVAQVEIAGAGFLNITLSARAYGDVVRQVRAQRAGYGPGDGLAGKAVTVAGEPGSVRGQVVAEVVNRLLRAAGASPAAPGAPVERLVVEESAAGPSAAGRLAVSGVPVERLVGEAAAGLSADVPGSGSLAAPGVFEGRVDGQEFAAGFSGSARAGGPGVPAEPLVGPEPGAGLSDGFPASGGSAAPGGSAGRFDAQGSAAEVPVGRSGHVTSAAPGAVEGRVGGREFAAEVSGRSGFGRSARQGAPAEPFVAGAFVSLGSDATRWALLRPPVEDVPRLGADLLVQRESNPLFRIRYAHARTRALWRNAQELEVGVDAPGSGEGTTYHHPAETELLGLIADFPRVVETAARRRAPDRLARHVERLADAFLRFQDECPPLPKGDEKPSAAHAARVRLADATGVVLAGGLHLLGISAPDHL